MIKRFNDRERHIFVFLLIFALIFVRYCCYGFEYYYQLDDYIQYHNYTAGSGSPWEVVMNLGILAARPLAGLADIYVWSNFFPVMLLGAVVVSVMFAASACLFKWVFSRHFGTGYIFLVVYTLLPLGFEGTYWMSASTRIVTGLFFAALALWAFEIWCSDGKKHMLAVYAVCQLLSYGFYEQIIAFSAASVILIALHKWLENRKIRSVWALWSFAAAALYFSFVRLFPNSALYGTKTEYIIPRPGYYFDTFLPELLEQLKSAFLGGGFYTLFKGFSRGAEFIFRDGLWLYVLVILLLSAVLFLFAKSFTPDKRRSAAAIIIGALLVLAPIAPFFVVANTWFSFRGTVCSFCGIALIADTLSGLLFSNAKAGKTVTACIASVFTLWCCVCAVSEVHDYKMTTEKDQAVVYMIRDSLVKDGYTDEKLNIGILNLEPTYLEEQNSYYHEHVHGVTESSWALSGALEWAMAGSPDITPLPASPMYRRWNREASKLSNFDALYLYDGDKTLVRVTERDTGGGGYELYSDDGRMLAYTWEEDETGYLELNLSEATSAVPS